MEYTDFLNKVSQQNAEEFSGERLRKLHLVYRDLSPQDRQAFLTLQEQVFVPAQKSAKRQTADYDLSNAHLLYNKIFTPSSIARRSYLFLQTLADIEFGPEYFTNRENLQSYLLAKTTSGRGRLTYLNRTYELQPGDVMLLDCRRHHEYCAACPEGWGYILVHFDGISMEDYYSQILAGGSVRFRFPENEAFDDLLVRLFEINQSNAPDCEMLTNCILIQMMTEIMKELPQFGLDAIPKRMQDVKDWITEHCREKISLDDLAAAFSLSKFHISREYKRYMGMTIFDSLHLERTKIAKGLLRYTNLPVAVIAENVGYESQSAFCRLFRQQEGMTALAYRRQWDRPDLPG